MKPPSSGHGEAFDRRKQAERRAAEIVHYVVYDAAGTVGLAGFCRRDMLAHQHCGVAGMSVIEVDRHCDPDRHHVRNGCVEKINEDRA